MSNLLKKINPNRIPKHIAVVMDGNGRWAKKHGYLRAIGHKSGVKAVREIVQASDDIGVKYLTLYTFSTENWNRPKLEVNALMELMIDSLTKELDGFQKNNVKIATIGDLSLLPSRCKKKFADVEDYKRYRETNNPSMISLDQSKKLMTERKYMNEKQTTSRVFNILKRDEEVNKSNKKWWSNLMQIENKLF